MKPPSNDGACHDNPNAEIPLTQSDEEEEFRPKQKRKRAPRVLATCEAVHCWVTKDKATQPEEDIQLEIFEHAKRFMHLSGLKKLPVHKGLDTDHHLWEKAGAHWHTSHGVTYILY